jgi:hypothetical protein
MTAQRLARAIVTLAVGYAAAAGLLWSLLNVPESNVLALTLSATLVVATTVAAGVATAASAALADGGTGGDAARQSVTAVPAFVVGLLVFGALWWVTGSGDLWWRVHRSEIDAISIRYLNVTRTGALHETVAWTFWLARWMLGLSAIAALVTTATVRGAGAVGPGLRNALRLPSLVAAGTALAIVAGGLSRLVYWRPAKLATWLEPVFVTSKLIVLYIAALSIVALVLAVYRRAARMG